MKMSVTSESMMPRTVGLSYETIHVDLENAYPGKLYVIGMYTYK